MEIPAHQQAYVTWDVHAIHWRPAAPTWSSAPRAVNSDASRPPLGTLDNQGLPILRYEAPETVGTSGQMTGEGDTRRGDQPADFYAASSGELSYQGLALAGCRYDRRPDLPGTFPLRVRRADHFVLPAERDHYPRAESGWHPGSALEASLSDQVATALQRLYNWQNPDGGWGWWSGEKSDPLTSAYVVLGLVEAQKAGYTIDEPSSGVV